jgi:hypothetical protein
MAISGAMTFHPLPCVNRSSRHPGGARIGKGAWDHRHHSTRLRSRSVVPLRKRANWIDRARRCQGHRKRC